MRDFLIRHRDGLLLTTLLLISIIIISQQAKDDKGMTYFKKGVITSMMPFQTVVSGVFGAVSGVWHNYIYLVDVTEQNREMKSEINRLRSEVQLLREDLYRAGRLEEFSKYIDKTRFQGTAAKVIGESPDPWMRTIVVASGSRDGIRRGMPVVTSDGLVGRVVEVSGYGSVVRLIVDRGSQVPVLVNRSRARAILEGDHSGICRMKYLDRTEDIRENDRVITSGLAGVYPRGIEVGRVSRITARNFGLFQYADVIPSAHLGRLEDVLILTGSEEIGEGE